MKQFAHGLVLGKFLPLHLGHVNLIQHAINACSEVTIQLLASKSESIPIAVRYRWLAEMFPGANIVAAYDEVRVDFDDPDIWDQHMLIIERLLPNPVDVVFTSDEYGAELARRLNAMWVQVDPGRTLNPISGTQIRKDPYKNWNWIPKIVRAYYTRRVVILGAESTGTTTLAKALGEALDCEVVPEYGREWSEIRPGGLESPWKHDEFVMIASKQTQLENETAANSKNGWLVCDTDAFATILWEKRYTSSPSKDVQSIARDLAPRRIYVLTGDEIPWVDDGLRDGRHIRSEMQQAFRGLLNAQHLPWIEVYGPVEDRLAQTLAFIREAFGN